MAEHFTLPVNPDLRRWHRLFALCVLFQLYIIIMLVVYSIPTCPLNGASSVILFLLENDAVLVHVEQRRASTSLFKRLRSVAFKTETRADICHESRNSLMLFFYLARKAFKKMTRLYRVFRRVQYGCFNNRST